MHAALQPARPGAGVPAGGGSRDRIAPALLGASRGYAQAKTGPFGARSSKVKQGTDLPERTVYYLEACKEIHS